jgi:lipopolysaccharide transport system permease protein
MSETLTERPVRVVVPPPRWPGLGLRELWQTRRILVVLSKRSFRARYSNMLLGVVWVILEPLLLTAIIAVLLGVVLDRGERYGLPYPVFLFLAWTGYRVWSRLANQGGLSIRGNGPLVERVYLPRAHFPLSVAGVSLVDLAAMVGALLVLLAVYGISPGIGLLTVPLIVLIMYAFGIGLAFFFSAASMSVPDVDIVRTLMVRAWFWLSPVIYSSADVPEQWRMLYYLNPMVVVIEGLRWAFAQAPMPPPEAWVLGATTAAITLVVGYVYFRRREPWFADLM